MFAVIFTVFIIACFFAWFYVQKSKEDERRLLIEKGFSPAELPDRKSFSFRFPWLKIGCVITCTAIGGALGFVLATYLNDVTSNNEAGLAFIICLFLFGGIGMIIAHYIDRPDKDN